MPFSIQTPHDISLQDASQYTRNYREKPFAATNIKAGFFQGDFLRKMLDQDGCFGIRFYFAIDAKGNPTLVCVGTDKDGNDLTNGMLGENWWPCPPDCDTSSPLFS